MFLVLFIPIEGIVTLRTGLAVPRCRGPSAMDRNSTYAVLSRNKQCRELRAHEGGWGSQKVTSDDEGEGGGHDTPQK